MQIDNIFPQRLALGSSFCNREEEQKRLRKLIQEARPTLITSPRRYGKTSLAICVLEKLKIPYSHLDLFPLADIQDIENAILGGIGDILALTEGTPQKALKLVSSFFSDLSISFKLMGSQISVDFTRKDVGGAKTILEALKRLDKTLKAKKQKAVLFLDEFQRLGQMHNSEFTEGAIRHVAQRSENLIFLFSGSNRHLLGKMFDTSTRPLYKLCNRIILNRISQKEYHDFLIKMGQKAFSDEIEEDAINCIMDLTARHSYYMNVLCSRLWHSNKIFRAKDVTLEWHNYALEEKSSVFKELELLSSNQMKLLIAISRRNGVLMPSSDDFLVFARLPLASVRQSLKVLGEKDYVYQDETGTYKVLDPLIKYILTERPIYKK